MKKTWSLLPLLLLCLGLAACQFARLDVGSLQEVTETVERQDARDARITVVMGAGELNISGGSANLMEAEFVYNVEDWVPEVSYEVSNGTGVLDVRQPAVEGVVGLPDGDVTNRWNLSFSDALPLELDVTLGAGENRLNLAELDVRSFSLEAGAGETTVNLGGNLEDLDVQAGVGELEINLAAADWAQDLDGRIRGGVGSTTLVLPSDVGVRVDVQQGLGSVNAAGFSQDGETYTNDAYGESDITLDLQIESGVGEVTLQMGG